MVEGLLAGISTAFSFDALMFLLLGCLAGTFIGMLPGLGPMTAIAIMIPIASTLEPAIGIIMMAAVYYGAIFGGSTSSILVNAPGVASTVATSFDGYPMARRGEAGKALTIAALSSFAGGMIAALMLILAAPLLAKFSLLFQSSDYFALMILGLVCVAAFAGSGGMLKALLMTVVGMMLATVGTDPAQGVMRFTLGKVDLIDGLSFLMLVMATFALSEALLAILRMPQTQTAKPIANKVRSTQISRAEAKHIIPAIGRSSLIGFLIGLLPGAGATIASFLAYGSEQRLASPSESAKFGQGSLRGLAAPEAANNAAATGSFVPLLTLGIPGSGTTAILLGALIAYGVQPGPMLYINEPALFWSVIVSMWLGNIALLALNLPLIPYYATLLNVPTQILMPMVLFFSLIGVYLISFNEFDIQLMIVFSATAVVLRLLDFPMAPMILGFILGGMIEENLGRALLIYNDSWSFLWERPLTFGLTCLTGLVLSAPLLRGLTHKVSKRK